MCQKWFETAGDTFKSPFKGHHDFVVKQFVAFPASLIAELKKLKQRVFPKSFYLRNKLNQRAAQCWLL